MAFVIQFMLHINISKLLLLLLLMEILLFCQNRRGRRVSEHSQAVFQHGVDSFLEVLVLGISKYNKVLMLISKLKDKNSLPLSKIMDAAVMSDNVLYCFINFERHSLNL